MRMRQDTNGILPYNIMNELNHTGNKNDNSSIDVAINLDWNVASWIKFSSILGASRSNVTQENWADEQSYYIFIYAAKPLWKETTGSNGRSQICRRILSTSIWRRISDDQYP